jgi:hypothetical protein
VEWLDAIVASVGSKCFDLLLYPATFVFCWHSSVSLLVFSWCSRTTWRAYETSPWMCKDPLLDSVDVLVSNWITGGLFEISSSEIAMYFLACLSGYFWGRKMSCLLATSGSWSKHSRP